mmetsp:Transcript_84700/g.254002  ORF Transcript_84700/g.254002 Transcript_84700/m.254002 type:complete len:232 (-) Transcript_84700:13-708(-)
MLIARDRPSARQELEVELSRAQFEALCEPLLRRLKAPLYEVALTAGVALPGEQEVKGMKKKPNRKARRAASALRPSGSQKSLPLGTPVDEIVMVGGASKMAAVRKLVTNLFEVDPRRTVDPMQAVALGAATQAGILSGDVRGMRVMQAWQADLGRILERMREPGAVPDAAAEASSSWLDEALLELGDEEGGEAPAEPEVAAASTTASRGADVRGWPAPPGFELTELEEDPP